MLLCGAVSCTLQGDSNVLAENLSGTIANKVDACRFARLSLTV